MKLGPGLFYCGHQLFRARPGSGSIALNLFIFGVQPLILYTCSLQAKHHRIITGPVVSLRAIKPKSLAKPEEEKATGKQVFYHFNTPHHCYTPDKLSLIECQILIVIYIVTINHFEFSF